MKIGIYGGTFNPIHNGHVHILKEFYHRLQLDMVLLIPTHVPPHKAASMLASAEDRIAMCELATREAGINCTVSDIEIKRSEKSYTALTLKQLRDLYPDDEIYLLMGEDMFLTVQNWYHPEIIFDEAIICASPRSDDGYEKLCRHGQALESAFGVRYRVEDIPYVPVSSTEIRKSIRDPEKISELVPEAVAVYLRERNLY